MFDGVLARGRVAAAVADEAWLRAMLDAEAGARAGARPGRVADAIAAAELDPRELGRRAAESGNPVVPLVEALRELAGPEVHRGATSQDILDTAAMLVARARSCRCARTSAPRHAPPPRLAASTARRRRSAARCCSRPCRRRSG